MRLPKYLSMFFVLILLTNSAALAMPKSLGDLNKIKNIPGSPLFVSVQSGNLLYFSRATESEGAELWVSDGTPAGTQIVKDIVPGSDSSGAFPVAAATIGGNPGVYFFATTVAEGRELWVTDGTEAGTHIVEDINPGAGDGTTGFPEVYTDPADEYAIFPADDGVNGEELWFSTDGTAANTNMTGDLEPGATGSDPHNILVAGPFIIFAGDTTANGKELFASFLGGAPALVFEIAAGAADSDPSGMIYNGSRIIFSADDGVNGRELWQTTIGATSLVSDLTPGAADSTLFSFVQLPAPSTDVIFTKATFSGSSISFDLIRTDGTGAGTSTVDNLPCAAGGFFGVGAPFPVRLFTPVDGKLVFPCVSVTTGESEPWVTDGTALGTLQLADIFPGNGSSGTLSFGFGSSNLIFPAEDSVHGYEPWVTDGSAAGTALLLDLNRGEASSLNPELAIGEIFFNKSGDKMLLSAVVGRERKVYLSDGTVGGTQELFDNSAEGTESSAPSNFFVAGGKVLFSATHTKKGRELFTTNGKRKGTTLFKNISRGGSSSPGNSQRLNKFNTLFVAEDYKKGQELWITDGTTSGTKRVKDINPGFASAFPSLYGVKLGRKIIFTADDGTTGTELWSTNGKRTGTKLILDVLPGDEDGVDGSLVKFGNRVFFSASDGVNGSELWVSDGTTAGTQMFIDINAGAPGSVPNELTVVGSKLFFSASTAASGEELWVSDGTVAGTMMVKDIVAGASGSNISDLVASGGILFFEANDGATGSELWRSDGTAAGTFLVEDIMAGASSSFISGMVAISGERVIFSADSAATGEELWVSGAAAGSAQLLKDILAGAGDGDPSSIYKVPNRDLVYFSAATVAEGEELWVSDGTTAGTVLAADIVPGTSSSSPIAFFAKGKKLYFSAIQEGLGREPMVLRIP